MDVLLARYRTQFGEQFPLMLCRTMTDDEICTIIRQCLNDNKQYTPELDPNANY